MEVAGGVAGIIQLVQFAGSLTEATGKVCQRLKHAPGEVQASKERLAYIRSDLQRTETTFNNSHTLLITPVTRLECQIVLADARRCVAELTMLLPTFDGTMSIGSRARWAMRDHRGVDKVGAELEAIGRRLEALIHIVAFYGTTLMLSGMGSLQVGVNTLHVGIGEVKNLLLSQSSGSTNVGPVLPNTAVAIPTRRPRPHRRLRQNPTSIALLCFQCYCIAVVQGLQTFNSVSFKVTTPLASILGGYTLVLHLVSQRLPMDTWSYSFNGSTFAVQRVISSNHRFMAAIRRGDVADVRGMLASGEGRVSDTDERKCTPLGEAIASGRSDVVSELLDQGADVNGYIGLKQTLPLQWAVWQKQLEVTRLLIAKGASQDHINGLGWNMAFFCWPRLRHGERCMLEFFHVLEEDMYQDLDVADTEGWTVLHRVAAFGHPEEVESLIKLGADPKQEALPLRWTAMHHAVFYGNYANYDTLLGHYGQDPQRVRDDRGWTLLHIAASAGHDAIVRHLLKLGADTSALSDPYQSHMPEVLFGRHCTVQDVAAAQSPERQQRYLEALRDVGVFPTACLMPKNTTQSNAVRLQWGSQNFVVLAGKQVRQRIFSNKLFSLVLLLLTLMVLYTGRTLLPGLDFKRLWVPDKVVHHSDRQMQARIHGSTSG